MSIRVAAAAVPGCDDVPTKSNVERAGRFVREAMQSAADLGARVIVFHEGALSYPHKRKISERVGEVGPANWSQVDWAALADELGSIADRSKELSIWTVIHAPHRLTGPNRPHNSMYVIADDGAVVTRYDKRFLSDTELRWLYTPGTKPVTFDVDGYRFGCALCIEATFPEVFSEYAGLGVDCVLYGTSGANDLHLRAHASLNGLWVAVADQRREGGPCIGIIDPTGTWHRPRQPDEFVAVATLDRDDPALVGARFGREWRLAARSGEPYRGLARPDDPRSSDRTSL